MATFYNQATLSIGGNTTSSNRTEGEVVTRVTIGKRALSTDYGPGDNIVYAITLNNTGTDPLENVTVIDDLGRTTPTGGPEIVPLTYVSGSVLYYVNGVLQPAPTVTAGPPLVFTGISIPAGGNALIVYETVANEYAPRDAGGSITNNASAEGMCDELSASATVPTRDEPLLTISKAICPESIICGDQVTYTFIIQNTGNTAVLATDDLIVSDLFNPSLKNITVKINGEITALYTYSEETGEFATTAGAVPVPEATFTRDSVTGLIATTPGVTVITVTGTI